MLSSLDYTNKANDLEHSHPASNRRICVCVAIAATILGGCDNNRDADSTHDIVLMSSPAAPGSLAPHLSVTATGEAVLNWLEPADADAHSVKFSILQGDAWSTPVTVAEDNGWFVNWADFPSVVPISAQQWASHWLVKRPGGTYSYEIALSTSADAGSTWSTPVTPHVDNTPTEHGFVSIFPWGSDIGAVWLDGRNMAPDTGGERSPEDLEKYGGMTLRYARLSYAGEILADGEIDSLACECCQTDVASTPSGPVVAYRDRTPDEIRDISVTRYTGGAWTTPVTVSDDRWKIPGCPVNGPAIAAEGDRVVVAWYGAPNRERQVKIAWSEDAGQTFSKPVVVDAGNVSGRVDIVLPAAGPAIVSWAAKTDDGAGQLRMREMPLRAAAGPVHIVTQGEYSRRAGFPQMVMAGNRLVYAWPEPGKPKQVLTAYSSLGE